MDVEQEAGNVSMPAHPLERKTAAGLSWLKACFGLI